MCIAFGLIFTLDFHLPMVENNPKGPIVIEIAIEDTDLFLDLKYPCGTLGTLVGHSGDTCGTLA